MLQDFFKSKIYDLSSILNLGSKSGRLATPEMIRNVFSRYAEFFGLEETLSTHIPEKVEVAFEVNHAVMQIMQIIVFAFLALHQRTFAIAHEAAASLDLSLDASR